MEAVLAAALPVFALILVGYVCGRRRILGHAATDSLNLFVVWLALPAVLFQAMAEIDWATLDQPGFVAAFGGGVALSFLLALVRNRRPLADASIEGLDAAYSNTGFMGIPLCLAVFGRAALPAAILATLLTASALFAAAIILIELGLQRDRRLWPMLGRVGLSLLRNPLIVSPLLGLLYALTGAALPAPVVRFTSLLGGAASPCALVTIGLFLADAKLGVGWRLVTRLVILKLLVQPVITGILAFGVFSMPAVWAQSALLLSALPTGTGPFMLAKLYYREAAVTSQAILISTVLSVVTISALIVWFDRAG